MLSSVADITLFYNNISWHQIATDKKEGEKIGEELGEFVEKYPNHWAILGDKDIKDELRRLKLFVQREKRVIYYQ